MCDLVDEHCGEHVIYAQCCWEGDWVSIGACVAAFGREEVAELSVHCDRRSAFFLLGVIRGNMRVVGIVKVVAPWPVTTSGASWALGTTLMTLCVGLRCEHESDYVAHLR
jgi:hypothetical protein